MASNDIVITVVGHLCKDAAVKQGKEGKEFLTFSLACNSGFGDKERVYYFACTSWQTGVKLAPKMGKGSQVMITGTFSEREYQGKMYKEIRVLSLAAGNLKPTAAGESTGEPEAKAAPSQDLPF